MTATMTVKNRKLSAIQIMELKNDILFLSLSFGEFFGFVNGLVHLTITEYHSGFPVAIAWAHYHLSVHYIVIMHIKVFMILCIKIALSLYHRRCAVQHFRAYVTSGARLYFMI